MLKFNYFLLVFFIFQISLTKAQKSWGGGRDDDNFHYGYLFRSVDVRYAIVKNPNWQQPYYDADSKKNVTDSLSGIYADPQGGFGIGIVTNLRLTDNIDVRFTPTLIFTDRGLRYEYKDKTTIEKKLDYPSIDFPLGIKLKTDRRRGFRAYLLLGVVFSTDISFRGVKGQADLELLDKRITNTSSYWGYEAGMGFDIYLEYFKLSPEIKIVNSFNSVLVNEDHPFSRPIDKLFLHSLQIGLIFE